MPAWSLLDRTRTGLLCLATVLAAILLSPAFALEPKDSLSYLGSKEFFLPELQLSTTNEAVEDILEQLPNRAAWERFLAAPGSAAPGRVHGFVDPRSGAATSILGSFPLIPGKGVGNRVTLEELGGRIGRPLDALEREAVGSAVRQFALAHRDVLGIDTGQLGEAVASEVLPELWQVSMPQTYLGIPVRYGRLVGTLDHGNLVVIGSETWGDVRGLSPKPKLTAEQALAAGFDYAGGRSQLDVILQQPKLEILPVAPQEHQVGEGFGGPFGAGVEHRLAWTFLFIREPELETWEVLVDAHSGEVLAFQDLNRYANNQIVGGVYPVTSTEICPTAGTCGVMQPGWPMPFADTGQASPNNFTNSGGIFNWAGGTVTTTLSGRFVNISDSCGTINNSSGTGAIDLGGVNGQHDCTTGGGSAGNTPASRTAFYELNRIAELARGWLPGNSWLNNQLTANVNLNNTCNAFWNGVTVNFYRSGGGCRNTGEMAGVFDHEWGHGLDDNDAGGSLSNTSEAYADIAGIYRLQDSCVGHGFFQTLDDGCGLTSDGTGFNSNEAQVGAAHCDLDCSGVRDADWDRHADHNPDTPLNFVCPSCTTGPGPCGRQVHCSAAPVRQAAWDLMTRDLPAAGFDSQTSFVIGNKLFYQGSGNVGTWYSCSCGSSSSGCGSASGYLQWLAADDDNGNLNDGTPHMQAIFNAFNRHGIACASPTPQNGGCAGGPSTAPVLTASPGENQVSLSWTGVGGAAEYWVFRTEGHAGCDFGKTKIAEVGGTSFVDTEVAGGREYHYNVAAAGTSAACFSPLSACQSVTPAMPGANAPTVSITAPPNGSMFNAGDPITFTGTADDPQEGDLSGSLVWNSSLDGDFGTGASVTTSALSVGTHTITASVTDGDGFTGSALISITIKPACDNEVYSTGFEADSGGWVDGASTCTTGTFIRGTPDLVTDGGVTTQPAGASTGTFAWFTQNNTGGVGTDDVDGGTCETLSPVINVGAGSTVSVFVDWYHGQRDAGDDANDGFSIELIDAASGAVLDTLVSLGDVTHNAVWTSAFSEVAGSPASIRLRVRATDAATAGDLVEGGLDNIQVCTGGCTSDADCDNGLACDGGETCNLATGQCQAGTPVDCSDGVACTVDSCNETTDSCDNAPDDAACDNGFFCDGAEICNPAVGCEDGPDPCLPSQTCNETTDMCEGGPGCGHSADFELDAGGWTNGADTCTTGAFIRGVPEATTWQVGGGNPGSAFFTASNPTGAIGTNDVDGGTCEALSPPVDCTGEAAVEVTLDYFHGQRDAGDDAADGFVIEVLNNGVVAATLVSVGDVTHNPAWTNVSAIVESPGTLQVRVRATDAAGPGDIVEGGVDNVQIFATVPPPPCSVEEGFEAGGLAGWFNDAASTCTTGAYVQGNPTNPGGGQQIVGSHTGTGSLFTAVNTAAGTDDVDGGNCILGSPTWNVTQASTLTVWYWHGQRDNGDDPAGDFFFLEVSTNRGATWSTLASNGDAPSSAVWTQATAPIAAGSDVRVRVQCSDGAGPGDLVECGIDDVSICPQ